MTSTNRWKERIDAEKNVQYKWLQNVLAKQWRLLGIQSGLLYQEKGKYIHRFWTFPNKGKRYPHRGPGIREQEF